MQQFKTVRGIAAPMLAANIDTDIIMPKQFLKGIDRNGLARGAFYDLRFLTNGEPNPDFILNQEPWRQASFLVVGPNFGCGSSREHAVWGLKQLGVRALIGTSFAGIFFDNCQRNGMLVIQLDDVELQQIAQFSNQAEKSEMAVDLAAQEILLHDGSCVGFEIDALRKKSLLEGLDAIGSTLVRTEEIKTFEAEYFKLNPWLI